MEPDDLIFSLSKVEKQWSLTEEEMTSTKEVYNTVCELLRIIMPEGNYQTITVGSYVIGCVTKYNMVVDCFLSLEKADESQNEESMSAITLKHKLDSLFQENSNRNLQNFSCELSSTDNKSLIIKDSVSQAAVKILVMTAEMFQNDSTINRASASIYHSNWLITLYNQTQNAWQTIKLFRIIRVWK